MDIANEEEVLKYLTGVMRNDEVKTSESFKAAELLGKYYGMFGDKKNIGDEVGDVIIVDNIPRE